MAVKQWLDRQTGVGNAHAGAEATYTTIFTILTAKFPGSSVLGLRGRAVYRNIGGNTGYAGYAETVGVWDDANQIIAGGNTPGNAAALGHVGSVAGLTVVPLKFVASGADILVQVSGLDTDNYQWFVCVDIEAYETA